MWAPIACAIIITSFLRISPLIITHHIDLDKFKRVIRFLEAASAAVIGAIIYSLAFENHGFITLFESFSLLEFYKILVIILAFWGCIILKSPMKSFLISLLIFVILISINFYVK